jgi:hypothetical protein
MRTLLSKPLNLAMLASLGLCAGALAPSALAGTMDHDAGMKNAKDLDCRMNFVLDGWSAAYMTAEGHGTVTCSNGKSLPVKLDAKGGGLSAGTFKIEDGRARFTHVDNIDDVLGNYGAAKAHIGAAKTAQGAVMTKGDVTASLGGTGNGWDIGLGFEKFTIASAGEVSKMPNTQQ